MCSNILPAVMEVCRSHAAHYTASGTCARASSASRSRKRGIRISRAGAASLAPRRISPLCRNPSGKLWCSFPSGTGSGFTSPWILQECLFRVPNYTRYVPRKINFRKNFLSQSGNQDDLSENDRSLFLQSMRIALAIDVRGNFS